MFSYGSPPVSSNRCGHNLLAALICNPHPPSTRKCFAPAPTYPLTIPDNIWFVTGEAQSTKGRKHTHLLLKVFICKMHLSFIKRATYSHFLRSLSSTFVVNENCFSEKWPLKRHSFRRNRVRMSLQVVSCELLGTSSGSMRCGSHRRRYPVWARSSRTLALEAISCKIYRHCRDIN